MSRLDQLFSTVGDGSGVTNMSAAADNYFVTPGSNERMNIARLCVVIQDSGKFAGEKYTAAAALTNGIIITKENAGGVLHTYTPQPIKTIGHWGLCAGVDMVLTDFTTGNDLVLVRWTLSKAEHNTILDGRKGEFMKIKVQDTLAALVEHIIQAQGTTEWVGG